MFRLRCSFSRISLCPLQTARHAVVPVRESHSDRHLQSSDTTTQKHYWHDIKIIREHYDKYVKVPNNPTSFFNLGKVFRTLWTEPSLAKELPPSSSSRHTRITFDELVHHTLRTFVVVEERKLQRFSYCLPVTMNGGNASVQPAVIQSFYAIAYTGQRPPEKLASEIHMKRDPIRFVLNHRIDEKSRINLGLEYPIKYGFRVEEEGYVHPDSMPTLLAYREEIRQENVSKWEPLGPAFYNPLTNLSK